MALGGSGPLDCHDKFSFHSLNLGGRFFTVPKLTTMPSFRIFQQGTRPLENFLRPKKPPVYDSEILPKMCILGNLAYVLPGFVGIFL